MTIAMVLIKTKKSWNKQGLQRIQACCDRNFILLHDISLIHFILLGPGAMHKPEHCSIKFFKFPKVEIAVTKTHLLSHV